MSQTLSLIICTKYLLNTPIIIDVNKRGVGFESSFSTHQIKDLYDGFGAI
jgi:hypothetical protein